MILVVPFRSLLKVATTYGTFIMIIYGHTAIGYILYDTSMIYDTCYMLYTYITDKLIATTHKISIF